MKTSEHGIQFIASFEGFRAKAYQDSGGVLTVGYGHTGTDVHIGLVITHDRALALLAKDVMSAERDVSAAIGKLRWKFSQHAFDALVSFVFNCGAGTLDPSRSLGRALRRGLGFVPAAMALYVKDAQGHTLLGLKRRRDAEGVLFVTRESPGSWLTRNELNMVRRFDTLRALSKPTRAERAELTELTATMTRQRKLIWRTAQPKGQGGDGRGWDYRDRRRRYNSLLARTT